MTKISLSPKSACFKLKLFTVNKDAVYRSHNVYDLFVKIQHWVECRRYIFFSTEQRQLKTNSNYFREKGSDWKWQVSGNSFRLVFPLENSHFCFNFSFYHFPSSFFFQILFYLTDKRNSEHFCFIWFRSNGSGNPTNRCSFTTWFKQCFSPLPSLISGANWLYFPSPPSNHL